MNNNNFLGAQQTSNPNSQNQNAVMFGQTLFGQNATVQPAPAFGQQSSSQSAPVFGQLGNNQSSAVFGQNTLSQSSVFGQTNSTQTTPAFGQTSGGLLPTFGQHSSSGPLFGQALSGQSNSIFAQATSGQSAPTSVFGQATSGQTAPLFGQSNSGQSAPSFGQSTGQSAPAFGQGTTSQFTPVFGQGTSSQSTSVFGQTTSAPAFGQVSSAPSAPAFGQVTTGQPGFTFGQAANNQSSTAFAQQSLGQTGPAFRLATTGQSSSLFGNTTNTQSVPAFGQTSTGQTGPTFGQSGTSQSSLFGQTTPSKNASTFAQVPSTQSTSLFAQAITNQSASFFTQPTASQSAPVFGSNTSIFAQATSESSQASRPSEDGSNQGPQFGQQSPSSRFLFGQTPPSQTAMFAQNVTAQGFSHTSSTLSGPNGNSQISAFGPVNSGQSNIFGQSPGLQPSFSKQEPGSVSAQPAQPSSAFGIAQSTHKAAAATEKMSVFGQSANISTGQTGSVFGATTQISTSSSASDSTFTQVAANSEHRFKPPAHTTFKPILAGANKSDESSAPSFSMSSKNEPKDQPLFGAPTSSSTSGNLNFFPMSSDKKSKSEAGTPRPSFASANSSFTNFADEPRREEGQKGLKRKEEHDRSPRRNDAAILGEASSDPHSEHQPIKRSGRLGRDLKGGANIYVRSLFDVVKSQMKTHRGREIKKGGNVSSQPKVTNADSPSKNQPVIRPLLGPNQTESVKTIAPSSSSQVHFNKSQMTGIGHAPPTRMVSFLVPNQQGSPRDHSSAGPSESISGRIRPLLEEGELLPDIQTPSSNSALNKGERSEGAEHSVPVSPSDLTTIVIRNVPIKLNKKNILEDYFKKCGKILRINCRMKQKIASIQFNDNNSAAAAKRAVKRLHKDMVAFWQRKKTSPAKKTEAQMTERKVRQNEQKGISTIAPVCKPLLRGLKGSSLKKTTFPKNLQFSVQNTDSSLPPPDISMSLPPSLSHLVGTVAETSEEKYRLLDQRDKIMRQARIKRTGLDQAKVFVGNCPDMCPEKERYMRDTRNQLSLYEFLPGTDKLDHAAAIKEYSRSSADQDEPLPHELRPLPVLCMTMDYMVTNIMDQGEENYREWYDFVWNRTRGIRKDITQQDLCDRFTVSLMEKCARFHIHCAYQLCEEPMSSFDPKINNENLTKCLQSLNQMYQDLQNRGETCPCEPEFRGYSVLLSLNKGDILREVQQFPESVRNTEEVKYAVQVFAALNSSNFVRFFKLVRSASYLNSCILHCYFPQVRRDGLRALNVAYTMSYQRPTLFPLENMVRFLFFHDIEEATDFLTSYGLSVSEGFVELNRAAFVEPLIPFLPKRSSYISSKRQKSIGEVVNGAPLPQFSLHMPVCSFDAQNKYTGSCSIYEPGIPTEQPALEEVEHTPVLPLSDAKEPSSVPAQAVLQPILPPEPPPSPPKPKFSDEDVAHVLEEILDDALKELSAPVIQSVSEYISNALSESSIVSDQLLADLILNFSRNIAEEEIKAEIERVKEEKRKKAEEARRIQERERLLSLETQSQCAHLINDVVRENVQKICKRELQKAVQLDHNERILRCSQLVCDQHVRRFVDEEIFHTAGETLYEMQCCSKYIQRWREVLAARKKLRRQMRAFPAAPGSVGRDGKLKALLPSADIHDVQSLSKGIINLGRAGRLSVSFTRCQQVREQIFHQMTVQHYLRELQCEAAWKPLELPSLVAKHLPTWKQCIFWKVVLALPEINDHDYPTNALSEWLKYKFSCAGVRPEVECRQQVQTLALHSSLESQGGCPVRVNICVKAVLGPLTENELEQVEIQKQFLGTSGIVLLLPVQSDADVDRIAALLQLKQLVQAKPFKPSPALAVLVPSTYSDPDTVIEKELNISDLVSCGLISDYKVFSIPDDVNDMNGTKMVFSAVEFLLTHWHHSLELRSLPFRQYIEDGVCSAFSNTFYHDQMERKKSGLPSQDPAAIIDLYNYAIAFLAQAVSSERLTELSWPVTEFSSPDGSSLMPPTDWNSPSHLSWLKKAVLSFQLPQMDKPPHGAPWVPVCSMIMDYVSQITRSPAGLPLLFSEVELLLGRIKKPFAQECTAGITPSVQDVPWDEIIALCINHKLRAWDPPLIPESKVSQEDFYVYFFEEDLRDYTYPDTWENARLSTHQNGLETSNIPQCNRKPSVQTPRTLHTGLVSSKNDTENIMRNPELSDLESLSSQLNRSLLAEKEEDERFNEKLQQLLVEEPLDDASLCLPLYLPIPSLSDSLENSIIVPALQKSSTRGAKYSPAKTDLTVHFSALKPSMKDRINELCVNLRRNQQEDIAFSLHLSNLLSMAEIDEESSSSNK
ncbi:germinal-center associated nuclear protein [Dendrobates tinctorius]|uniref:germinal-center associated nuclear protein n=1 Tax=Dendrobates tinctorius TaxID=92724 RepID=UPI003CCA2F9E